VKFVVELGFPELTTDQIEQLCQIAENAARKFILSKVSSKQIDRLDVVVEAEGQKPVEVTVEVELELSAETKDVDAKALATEASSKAHSAAENYLRKLTCPSKK
jgi:hypothetical protein